MFMHNTSYSVALYKASWRRAPLPQLIPQSREHSEEGFGLHERRQTRQLKASQAHTSLTARTQSHVDAQRPRESIMWGAGNIYSGNSCQTNAVRLYKSTRGGWNVKGMSCMEFRGAQRESTTVFSHLLGIRKGSALREKLKRSPAAEGQTLMRHTGSSVCAQVSRRAQTIVKAQVRDVGLQRWG